jgi:hypothetical protein
MMLDEMMEIGFDIRWRDDEGSIRMVENRDIALVI